MAKGYGIGLSLAKNIIEAHGGQMDLESEPGRGSNFFFFLPLWNHQKNEKRDLTPSAERPTQQATPASEKTYA
jgi:nitrogen-specific signal transduction histidine kinase